jgi:hypothetical protein
MSTHSMDKLVERLNIHWYPSPTGNNGDDYRRAIITKLRAADRLLAIMRLIELRTDESGETWFSISNEGGRSASINVSTHGPIVRGALLDFEARRKKAVADYEDPHE